MDNKEIKKQLDILGTELKAVEEHLRPIIFRLFADRDRLTAKVNDLTKQLGKLFLNFIIFIFLLYF